MDYLVITSSPEENIRTAWNECLNHSSYAGHYSSPEFFSEPVAKEAEPFAILVSERGVIQGSVTGTMKDGVMTCGESGSPRVCIRTDVDTEKVAGILASGLKQHAPKSVHLIRVFSWSELTGFQEEGFSRKQFSAPLGTIVLDLSKGSEALFREFSETRRNKIRRAIRGKVEVREMDIPRDFDEYYSIYADWCRFKQLPCQPYASQRSAFEAASHRLILVARHEGKIIGVSTFRYRRPGIVEYAANVSRRAETKWRQNDLLLWRAIEWSASQPGIRWFSTAAAHYFLQKLGGELRSTYRYSLDRSLFRRHHMVEGVRNATISAYRILPTPVKSQLKRLLRRESEQD